MTHNKSPFIEGNEWRFSKGKQPVRTPTLKQQSKMIEKLLSMSFEEVKTIALDEDNAVFLRISAQKIIGGDINSIVELIAKYRLISGGKEKKNG